MTIIDAAADFKQMQDCWFPHVLNLALRQLTPPETQKAIAWINTHAFGVALGRPNGRMNVTEAVRTFFRTIQIGPNRHLSRSMTKLARTKFMRHVCMGIWFAEWALAVLNDGRAFRNQLRKIAFREHMYWNPV